MFQRRRPIVRHAGLLLLLLLPLACGGTRSSASTMETSPISAVSPGTASSDPCTLLTTGDIATALDRAAMPGRPDPTDQEPNCLWPLTNTTSDSVAVRLYTNVMQRWIQPQPQDDQVVSGLGADAHWDTRTQYLAVRHGRQAFHVQVYTAGTALQHLQSCTQLARIILTRLPQA